MKYVVVFFFSGLVFLAQGQETDSTKMAIEQVIMWYIDGTATGDTATVRKAFHPDFNLYAIDENENLLIRSGKEYINKINVGQKNERQGKIISVDYEVNAAMAKAEIVVPGWRIFTDYFLLMKYQGEWKIVQKSYTWIPDPVSPSPKQ